MPASFPSGRANHGRRMENYALGNLGTTMRSLGGGGGGGEERGSRLKKGGGEEMGKGEGEKAGSSML